MAKNNLFLITLKFYFILCILVLTNGQMQLHTEDVRTNKLYVFLPTCCPEFDLGSSGEQYCTTLGIANSNQVKTSESPKHWIFPAHMMMENVSTKFPYVRIHLNNSIVNNVRSASCKRD